VTYSFDTNILLYATFSQYPEHKASRRLLDTMLAGENLCVVTWDVIYSYLRIATHPSVFATPLSPGDALENIENILVQPGVSVIGPSMETWHIFGDFVREQNLRGNDIPDAAIASTLSGNGVFRFYTNDKGFKRFEKLEPVAIKV
jgi:toxin-antitoxin system PIN domain toxin